MIDHALYTHSRQLSGWGVVGCSRPLDPDLEELVRARSAYPFPVPGRVLGPVPDRADDEPTLPASLRLVVDGPLATLVAVHPTGRELSGSGVRGGNIVAHVLMAETAEQLRPDRTTRPIQLVGSPALLDHEPDPFDPQRLEVLTPGPVVDETTALAVLDGRAVADAPRDLVAAVLRAHWAPDADCGSVCIVGQDPTEVLGWLAVVAYWLPVGLTWQIAFDTFSARPDQVLTVAPPGDAAHRGATVCGAVADLLEVGVVAPSTLLFDFTADQQPSCAPVGSFATRLLATSLVEARPLLGVIDDLAGCSEVPVDEEGWLALLCAASLLLGGEVEAHEHRMVATWMAAHAVGLGPARVEVLAMALDLDALDADQLLAVVGAGSAVESLTVAERFEEVTFARSLERVLDRTLPPPTDVALTWSPAMRDRAEATLRAELQGLPVDLVGRLIRFAGSTGVDLTPDLETAGDDLVPLVVEGAVSFDGQSSEQRLALARRLIAQIDAEPLPDPLARRLQDGIRASGLQDAIKREDLVAHPVAAVQILLSAEADDDARLRLLGELVQPPQDWPPATAGNLLSVLWPGPALTVAVLEQVLALVPSLARSRRLAAEVDRLTRATRSIEDLLRLAAVADEQRLDWMLVSTETETTLRAAGHLRHLAAGQRLFGNQVDDLLRTITHRPPEVAVALAQGLGRVAAGLTAHQGLMAYRWFHRQPGRFPYRPMIDAGRPAVCRAYTDGAREALDELEAEDEAARIEIVVRVAPGLLEARHTEELEQLCRHALAKWDNARISAVETSIAKGCSRAEADAWQEWASHTLRRRLLGRG